MAFLERLIPSPAPNAAGLLVIDLASYLDGPLNEVFRFSSLSQANGPLESVCFVAVSNPGIVISPTSGARQAIATYVRQATQPICCELCAATATTRYHFRTLCGQPPGGPGPFILDQSLLGGPDVLV